MNARIHLASQLANSTIQTDLKNLVLDRTETVGKNFETVDSSVCAILVKKHSDPGAVRVDAPGMPSVETGPQKNGFDIMVINPGQTCMFYSNPTVRYFKRA